jgi:hypothetical protein
MPVHSVMMKWRDTVGSVYTGSAYRGSAEVSAIRQ